MLSQEKVAKQAKLEIVTAIERKDTLARPKKPKAILVIHGMGQQVRFETLDQVANGLNREDVLRYQEVESESARAARAARPGCVQFGDVRLERFEMKLRTGTTEGSTAPVDEVVHIYEAYWSPLTEGAVTLRDVTRFLFSAGLNRLRNANGKFVHWAFGKSRERNVPVQTPMFLMLSLWVIASLAVINTVIVLVPAARSMFTIAPTWLSDELFRDLTDLFNAVLIVLMAFGLIMSASLIASRFRLGKAVKLVLAVPSLVALVLSLLAIVAAGVAVPLLIVLHGAATDSNDLLIPGGIRWLGSWTPVVILGVAGIAVVFVLVPFALSLIAGYFRQFGEPAPFGKIVRSTVLIGLFVGIACCVAKLAWDLLHAAHGDAIPTTREVLTEAPVWAALVGVSIFVRGFLVQYVGDVAVYVSSHTIDRFHDLRIRIKDSVWKTAHAVYAQKTHGEAFDYDEIIVTGHSLGSVIAYDTLNRLLLADATAMPGSGKSLDVAKRTRLLLTFGSPLDKTAYLFANQSRGKSLTDARESLAAIVQPLIDSCVVRETIDWINIYSPWDIISGKLDFYNDPEGRTNEVRNERDQEAVTPLAAHVEYWRNWLVFKRLYDALQ